VSVRCKVANNRELFLAEPVQFFLTEAACADQASKDEREHGVPVVVLGVDVLAPLAQVILQLPQVARLLNLCGEPLRLTDDGLKLPVEARSNFGEVRGSPGYTYQC